ncbi:MAG TPA: VOC family protein [Chloroflexota bacterium]|nr:VOC family protein [Chloroflexota bacterium]
MLKQIDHIVVVARNLTEAEENFRRAGFTVTTGGEHVGGLTHNALISFGDGTYFELIAFHEPETPQEHRWWERLSRGEGLVDYALLSDDLNAEAARVRGAGLPLRGPADGGRLRPDGQELIWRSFFLGPGVSKTALPFVIEDLTPRELRVPGGAASSHQLPVTRVAGISLVVADLAAASEEFQALLNLAPAVRDVPGLGPTARFQLGAQWLELIQPSAPGTPAAEHLRRLGEGPYEVVLSGERGANPGEGDLLSGPLNGARIRVA